jgi:hypothetical protein
VRVPAAAANGTAKVAVSFAAWTARHVHPSTTQVAVGETPAELKTDKER